MPFFRNDIVPTPQPAVIRVAPAPKTAAHQKRSASPRGPPAKHPTSVDSKGSLNYFYIVVVGGSINDSRASTPRGNSREGSGSSRNGSRSNTPRGVSREKQKENRVNPRESAGKMAQVPLSLSSVSLSHTYNLRIRSLTLLIEMPTGEEAAAAQCQWQGPGRFGGKAPRRMAAQGRL